MHIIHVNSLGQYNVYYSHQQFIFQDYFHTPFYYDGFQNKTKGVI